MEKLWQGRFSQSSHHLLEVFNESISFDNVLAIFDIIGSIAHVKMLSKQKIISEMEKDLILNGLNQIEKLILNESFEYNIKDEDIHMAIEKKLIELIGETGKKIHTARSRNDQIATDTRLYVKNEVNILIDYHNKLIQTLVMQAKKNYKVIFPGYTHLQPGMPISLGHYFLAYVEMLKRDVKKLKNAYEILDECPLGSGALAGTSLNIDRHFTANNLGFARITQNSLDAIADRDYILDILYCNSLTAMHLSRLCEDLIIYSSYEFGYITISDAFTTGSSMMPQKKNADVCELMRGKSGRQFGHLFAVLTVMKGLPLTYNKDMQEDKEALFDSINTTKMCLTIMTEMLPTITINESKINASIQKAYLNATDLADYLVLKEVPFRNAHDIVGQIVAYGIKNDIAIEDIKLDILKSYCDLIEEDVYTFIELENCVLRKNSEGGTSFNQVIRQFEKLGIE